MATAEDAVMVRSLLAVHPYFAGKEAVVAQVAFATGVRGFMDLAWRRFVFPVSMGLDDLVMDPFVNDESYVSCAAFYLSARLMRDTDVGPWRPASADKKLMVVIDVPMWC